MTRAAAPLREKIRGGSPLVPTLAWQGAMWAALLLGADHREDLPRKEGGGIPR